METRTILIPDVRRIYTGRRDAIRCYIYGVPELYDEYIKFRAERITRLTYGQDIMEFASSKGIGVISEDPVLQEDDIYYRIDVTYQIGEVE